MFSKCQDSQAQAGCVPSSARVGSELPFGPTALPQFHGLFYFVWMYLLTLCQSIGSARLSSARTSRGRNVIFEGAEATTQGETREGCRAMEEEEGGGGG